MRLRIRILMALVAIVGVVALSMTGLPGSLLRHQPESSVSGGVHEALAGDEVAEDEDIVQELLDKAKQYDQEAEHHEKEAQRYEQKAATITSLTDTKGFRRDGKKVAADSHRAMAGELRFHARTHRIEAELLMEKAKHAGKEK
ncbi:MAG: hypothetical protein P0111_12090 [Nitrospira sp.]|nr:hypothetical protein [Nitrospira sp.]